MSKQSYPTNDKPCVKCGSTKRGKPRKNRTLGDCLDCLAKNSKEFRLKNKDRVRDIWNAWEKANLEKVKEANNIKIQKWVKDNPEKYKAHQKIRYRIRIGKLLKPSLCICTDCGKSAEDYHHTDYSKPLNVIPLCKPCHRSRHEKIKATISI